MSGTRTSNQGYDERAQYEIRIHGHLDDRWAGWFEGFTLAQELNGDTLISGQVIDQAALFGLLRKVRDTGLTLISVNSVEPDTEEFCKT